MCFDTFLVYVFDFCNTYWRLNLLFKTSDASRITIAAQERHRNCVQAYGNSKQRHLATRRLHCHDIQQNKQYRYFSSKCSTFGCKLQKNR